VFAKDIDAAGRGHDPARRPPVLILKFSGNVVGKFSQRHGVVFKGLGN
jgi:hypothetical protein